jgi:serine/threonine-protein kinase RsbW
MHEGGRATVDELDWSGHRPTASYSDSKPACSSEAILRGASAPRAKRLRGRSLSRFLAANCVQAVASRSSGGTAAGLPGARTDPSRALSDLARVAYASPASVPSVGASSGTDAAWSLPAVPSTVRELRRRAIAFASAAGASRELTDAVALAVSEIVTNAVMHAYVGREPGPVAVQCRTDGERMSVRVIDEGAGLAARDDSPGIGHGLATVGALAQALEITSKPDGSGTVVTMSFGPSTRRPATPGFEPLCALAGGRRLVRGPRPRRRPASHGRPGGRRSGAHRVASRSRSPDEAGDGDVEGAARRRRAARRTRPERASLTRRYRRAASADVVGRRAARALRWCAGGTLGPGWTRRRASRSI